MEPKEGDLEEGIAKNSEKRDQNTEFRKHRIQNRKEFRKAG